MLPLLCGAKRIAVLDLQPGGGVPTGDAGGLSAIFTTYFHPEGYVMVTRGEVDNVIEQQKFQPYSLDDKQIATIAEQLDLSIVVTGNLNMIMGDYNVDIMAIDIESGSIIATEGTSFNKNTYRDGMKDLAIKLSEAISDNLSHRHTATSHSRTYSKEELIKKGFRFMDDAQTYAIIDGVNGRAAIQAFVCGEYSDDKWAYTAKKLDKSWYISGDNDGKLNGLMILFANGSAKSSPETFIGYVCDGQIAYPLITLHKSDYRAIGIYEPHATYYEYCTLWKDKRLDGTNRPLFTELLKVYGPQIINPDFFIQGTDGKFDIKKLKDNFDYFMDGDATISPSAWWGK